MICLWLIISVRDKLTDVEKQPSSRMEEPDTKHRVPSKFSSENSDVIISSLANVPFGILIDVSPSEMPATIRLVPFRLFCLCSAVSLL